MKLVSTFLSLCAISVSAFTQVADVHLQDRMSAADFRKAGLHKLDPGELAALNSWLASHPLAVAEVPQGERVSIPRLMLVREGSSRGCPGKASATEDEFTWDSSDEYCEDSYQVHWPEVQALEIECPRSGPIDFCHVWITVKGTQRHFEGGPERRITRLPALVQKHNTQTKVICGSGGEPCGPR